MFILPRAAPREPRHCFQISQLLPRKWRRRALGPRLALSEPLTGACLCQGAQDGQSQVLSSPSGPPWLCRKHVSLGERAIQTGHHPRVAVTAAAQGTWGQSPMAGSAAGGCQQGTQARCPLSRPWRLAGCLFAQTWAWPLPCGLNPSIQLQLSARSLGSSEAPSPGNLRPWNCMCGGIFLALSPHSIFWERLIN